MVAALTLYRTHVGHRRTESVAHEFAYRSYWWLVDVDQIHPRLPRWIRFEARDYIGDAQSSIGANVRSSLAAEGIDPTGLTIRMLSSSRQYGYSFNPLTMFYCQRADSELVAVVAEVHNTYGERHRYVLRPDPAGMSRVDKQLYVSPFFDVTGTYLIDSPVPGRDLYVSVKLIRDNLPPFVATVRGVAVSPSRRALFGVFTIGSGVMTSLRIRRQGIALWRKGLQIEPRPHLEGAHRG